MSKKNIIILVSLIILWIIMITFMGNDKKKSSYNSGTDYYSNKKKVIKQSEEKSGILENYGVYLKRKELQLYEKPITKPSNKTENNTDKKPEEPKVQPVIEKPPEPEIMPQEVLIEAPQPPQPTPQEYEEQNIRQEIEKIEVLGNMKKGGVITVFMKYKGINYEVVNGESMKIKAGSKEYDLIVKISDEFIIYEEESTKLIIRKKK